MQEERTAPLPSPPAQIERLPVQDGVLVADGYGIKLTVRNGRLVVSDGIGRDRRESRFSRATCGLRRVVVLGGTGYVTLEASRWIADVGASLVHVDRDGRLLGVAAPSGRNDPRLRRAQALAAGTSLGAAIARDLLQDKLAGQARLLDRLKADTEPREAIASALAGLDTAKTPSEQMVQEAAAAIAYWDAWSSVAVSFVRADLPKVPDHWRTFGRRSSPLTGNTRLAANPANAVLNYLYAILEAECRIACLTVGLDPGLGVLHADQANRDSMALDLMEAVRPQVDAYVLDLLEGHVFRAKDFHETRQGVCRVLAPLTHHLSGMAPLLRRAVGPAAERVARMLFEAPGSNVQRVPTPITGDRRRAGGEGVRTKPRRISPNRAKPMPSACRSCGVVLPAGRLLCDECLPEQKGEALALASDRATIKLAGLRSEGRDPAHGGEAARKRGRSNAERIAAAQVYERESGPLPDREVFARDILPGLQAVPIRAMAVATGLTKPYCSMVRRGLHVPHPRHWGALERLVAQTS